MGIRLFYIVVTISIAIGRAHSLTQCNKRNECACTLTNGQYFDLTSLARKDGLPRFSNLTDIDGADMFSWNPCVNFSQGGCHNVAVCQIRPMFPEEVYFDVGNQASANFVLDQNGVWTLQYTAESGRTTIITLICDANGNNTLEVIGQKGLTSYFLFELRSPLACPQGIPNPTTTTENPLASKVNTLEGLVIVTLVLLVILIILMIAGFLKMTGKICKQASYDELN